MRRTITWVLYILMGVQIALGSLYLVSNFGTEQRFRENLASFLPAGAVCLMQLIPAAISLWYVLGKFGFRENRYLRSYVCAFFLTVPFFMHIHLARLIWSSAFSVYLWLLGLILETLQNGLNKKRAVLLFVAWFLYGIVCPDGLWLGGILLFVAAFFCKKNQKKDRKISGRGMAFWGAALLMAGIIFITNIGLNSAFLQARKIYRENNFGTAVVSRFVWPNFGKNYFFWSDDVKAVLSEEDAVEISERIDMITEEFYPLLKETYGEKKATMLCIEMGHRCLMDRTREIALEIGRDLKDYFLLPFTIERNLKGSGVSLTAWNYGRMREHTPHLVKYYYRYGIFELPFLLLGSFLLWCARRNDDVGRFLKRKLDEEETKSEFNKVGDSKRLSEKWKLLIFTGILYTFWYTLRSNFPVDYKMALPILFVWYLAAVGGLLCQKAQD